MTNAPFRRLRAVAFATVLAAFAAMPAAITPAAAREAPASFADLAADLLPGVVNVASSQSVQARAGNLPEMPVFPPGSPFEQFFHDFMEKNRPGGPGGGQGGGQGGGPDEGPVRKMQSLGSGFVVDGSGIIVTNNHVIDGADEITVTLQDGTSMKAKLVGRDDRTDIAVLQVKPDKPLHALSFGDSSAMRVGDWVLAIGNPFGLGGTVTAGIVSARGRDIRQGPYDDFIQTDAPINRGNSGGPLFNMNGEVIGINTAIYSPSGGSIGIGFAIPSNMAKTVVAQLLKYGKPRRGWLGVRIQQVTPDIAESLGLKEPRGVMVAGVTEGGPADKAQIKNGDIILKFNNQEVKELHNLPRMVAETAIGTEVPVVLWRDGKEETVSARIAEMPEDDSKPVALTTPAAPPVAPVAISGLGLKVAPIGPDTREKFQLNADQKGVVIIDVGSDSAAAERGLRPGDVIMQVQQEDVNSPADIETRVARARKQNRKMVLLLIQGQDGLRWVPLPLAAPAAKGGKPPPG